MAERKTKCPACTLLAFEPVPPVVEVWEASVGYASQLEQFHQLLCEVGKKAGLVVGDLLSDVPAAIDLTIAHVEALGEDHARALQAEVAAIREVCSCEECGAPGTRFLSTEGDGSYWLCDSTDEAHGPDVYGWDRTIFRFPSAGPSLDFDAPDSSPATDFPQD